MNILLIEDDVETADQIEYALRKKGNEVERCGDGLEGLGLARTRRFRVLIVDRMLPTLDGLSLVRTLRSEGIDTSVLFLTTMSGLDDRVEGLEGGGDDYLVKPFAFAELSARVNAILRRPNSGTASQLRFGGLEMDLIRRTVFRDGKPIELRAQEFRLLEFFIRHAGCLVTRTMLLENVWELHFDPRTNVVETHISRLRSKLDDGHSAELIHTVRGLGYCLATDLNAALSA